MTSETWIILLFTVIMTLLFGLPGIIGLVIFLIQRGRKEIDSSWSTVTGKVTSASLERLEEAEFYGGQKVLYQPVVEYTYEVDGYTFTSKQVETESSKLPMNRAQDILNRHPVGSNIIVYFNPRNAAQAIAQVRRNLSRYWLVAGILLTGFSLCIACSGSILLLRIVSKN